jgi:hypothetical protein
MSNVRRLIVGMVALLGTGALPATAAAEQDYECITITTTYRHITYYSDGTYTEITTTISTRSCRPI